MCIKRLWRWIWDKRPISGRRYDSLKAAYDVRVVELLIKNQQLEEQVTELTCAMMKVERGPGLEGIHAIETKVKLSTRMVAFWLDGDKAEDQMRYESAIGRAVARNSKRFLKQELDRMRDKNERRCYNS